MLGERITEHGVSTWLVNTGWTGGAYGVGSRMPIAATRAIVRAALSGELDGAETRTDPIFGFEHAEQMKAWRTPPGGVDGRD